MSVVDLSPYAYHADLVADQPSLSASIIHDLVTGSPAHAKAKHPKLNLSLLQDDKLEYDIGTASHSLLLEGDAGVEVLAFDNFTTKAAREARDLARAHGRVPLLDKHWTDVQAMTAATREQLDRVDARPPLFTDGKAEQTLVWEEDGVVFRSRLDWLRDDRAAIDDYKTATSASPDRWSRSMFDHGCDIQAAMYLRGARAVFGADPVFRFVVQEKTEPYALCVFSPAPDTLALAERKIEWAIKTWRHSLETGSWPAYPPQVCWVNLNAWDEVRWLDREARDA